MFEYLRLLAVVMQMADMQHTCAAINDGHREVNTVVYGAHATCNRVVVTKMIALVPVFLPEKWLPNRYRYGFAVGNIGAGTIGVFLSVTPRK